MTSIEPVRQRNQPSPIQEETSWWNSLIDKLEQLDRATRASAAATLNKTAALIETIAHDPDKIARLLQSLKRIENIKTREAAYEALGFEHDAATAFTIKTEQGFAIFKNGISCMHKRKPVTIEEASRTLLTQARKLRIMADVFKGSTMGEAVENRRARSELTRSVGDTATVAWDLASYGSKVLGPVGGLILAAGGEVENDVRWEFEKLISLTPISTIQDLENARADYLKGYAMNRIGLILSPLPGSGTALTAIDSATGDGRKEVGTALSMHQLLQEATNP
jgi:hypothetical protein